MFAQAAAVAARISVFRAGPQDFPYSPTLSLFTIALAVLAQFLQYRVTLPIGAALVHGAAWVAALAAFTYVLLQPRGLLNRMRQTLDSLYVTSSVLVLLMLPSLDTIAPYMARVDANPDLPRTEAPPGLATLVICAGVIWNLLIWSHIYRNALDTRPGVGVAMAFIASVITASLAGAVGALLS